MLNPIKTRLTVLIVGLACLGIGVLFASTLEWTPTTLALQSGTASAPTTQSSLRETGNAFIEIAQSVTPAVVSIRGQQRVTQREMMPDLGPFDRFFQFQEDENHERIPDEMFRRSGVRVELPSDDERRIFAAVVRPERVQGNGNVEAEVARLRKEIARAEGMLGNEKFVRNARPEVVEAERVKLARYRRELDALGG